MLCVYRRLQLSLISRIYVTHEALPVGTLFAFFCAALTFGIGLVLVLALVLAQLVSLQTETAQGQLTRTDGI